MFPCRRNPPLFVYFAEFFPYRTFLNRIERGAQNISLYAYACKPSKVMSNSSGVLLFPSAFFHQLPTFVYTFQSSPLGVRLPKGDVVSWKVGSVDLILPLLELMDMWVKLTSSLGPSPSPNMDELINVTKLPLSYI